MYNHALMDFFNTACCPLLWLALRCQSDHGTATGNQDTILTLASCSLGISRVLISTNLEDANEGSNPREDFT